jgi:hypothetical protein
MKEEQVEKDVKASAVAMIKTPEPFKKKIQNGVHGRKA